MNKSNISINNTLFFMGLILFIAMAWLGWQKLPHGFSLIDEGYRHAESWRLSMGDHLFKDGLQMTLVMYTVLNAALYKLHPDFTLLGFRQLQFFMALFSMGVLGASLFYTLKKYWFLPWVLSVFAFTGLDPMGLYSNLNYYTWPHFFLTLHLAALLPGLYAKNKVFRYAWLALAGLLLWCVSLCLSYLGLLVIYPFILWLARKTSVFKNQEFTLPKVIIIIAPTILLWLAVLAVYNDQFIASIFSSLELASKSIGREDTLYVAAFYHISFVFIYTCLFWCIYRYARRSILLMALPALSVLMFFIIDSSLFGLITPYWRGWGSRPMWFSALIVSSLIITLLDAFIFKISTQKDYDKDYHVILFLALPCFLFSIINSFFSGMELLTPLLCAIPAVLAISLYYSSLRVLASKPIQLMALICFFLPFFYWTMWSDWRFTFFDVFPEMMNQTIEKGFAKGIKTCPDQAELIEWIRQSSEKYSKPEDFMMAYFQAPMTYMIAKRRPAMDHTWSGLNSMNMEFFAMSVDKMKQTARYPKLAYVFTSPLPIIWPLSMKESKFHWNSGEIRFPVDPISIYVTQNMVMVDTFKINDLIFTRLFVDPLIGPDKPELINERGLIAMSRNNNNLATDYFKKALYFRPKDFRINYNMACAFARQNKVDEAISWLNKAVGLGFEDLNQLQNDKDFDNIRTDPAFKRLAKAISKKS